MTFAEFMRQRREGVSLQTLAKLTGISRQHLANIESGRSQATIEKAEKICRALKCEYIIKDWRQT